MKDNFIAFIKCCLKNKVTLTQYIFLVVSVLIFSIGYNIKSGCEICYAVSIYLFVIFLIIIILNGPGISSFRIYKSTLNTLERNEFLEKPFWYNEAAGQAIAKEHFEKYKSPSPS